MNISEEPVSLFARALIMPGEIKTTLTDYDQYGSPIRQTIFDSFFYSPIYGLYEGGFANAFNTSATFDVPEITIDEQTGQREYTYQNNQIIGDCSIQDDESITYSNEINASVVRTVPQFHRVPFDETNEENNTRILTLKMEHKDERFIVDLEFLVHKDRTAHAVFLEGSNELHILEDVQHDQEFRILAKNASAYTDDISLLAVLRDSHFKAELTRFTVDRIDKLVLKDNSFDENLLIDGDPDADIPDPRTLYIVQEEDETEKTVEATLTWYPPDAPPAEVGHKYVWLITDLEKNISPHWDGNPPPHRNFIIDPMTRTWKEQPSGSGSREGEESPTDPIREFIFYAAFDTNHNNEVDLDDPQEATRELNITILKEKELILSETTNPDNMTEIDEPGNPEGLTHYIGQDRNEQAKLDITLKFLPENANLPAQIAQFGDRFLWKLERKDGDQANNWKDSEGNDKTEGDFSGGKISLIWTDPDPSAEGNGDTQNALVRVVRSVRGKKKEEHDNSRGVTPVTGGHASTKIRMVFDCPVFPCFKYGGKGVRSPLDR